MIFPTSNDLESIQHESWVLGQATGLLLKYGYKNLATEVYTTALAIFKAKQDEQLKKEANRAVSK